MSLLVHRTRSVRVTITPPEGDAIVVENLQFNEGFEVDFGVRRTMTPDLGEIELSIYNLPAVLRGDLEAAQVRKPDDLDEVLAVLGKADGWGVYTEGMDTGGADALANGLPLIRLEAGFDGDVSTVFEAVGARLVSERADEVTYVTSIKAIEALDAALYAKPVTVFPAGTPTFEVMNWLRIGSGLGVGNVTFANWSALLGDSTLDAAFYSTMGGFEALSQLLNFLPLRWFVDDRELWVLPKEGQSYPGGAPPAFIPGEPVVPDYLLERPRRIEGGFVEARFLLTPLATPGRLLVLSDVLLGLEGADPEEVARADVPPGLYRIEEVSHEGTTAAGGAFDTAVRLKRIRD